MAGQQGQLFDTSKINSRITDPQEAIVGAVQGMTGGSYDPEDYAHTRVKGVQGGAMFRAYKDAQAQDPSPEMIQSYEALRGHISSQFDSLTKPVDQGGAGLTFEATADDPYSSMEEMHKDVTDNSRLRVMSTATTGSHSFFTDEENDQFRFVHDAIGHLATGRGFSRHGEEAAFRSHRDTLPEEAWPALASETRGQNSFLNWGGGGFPDNRPVNVPQWMTQETPDAPEPEPAKPEYQTEQLSMKFPGYIQ